MGVVLFLGRTRAARGGSSKEALGRHRGPLPRPPLCPLRGSRGPCPRSFGGGVRGAQEGGENVPARMRRAVREAWWSLRRGGAASGLRRQRWGSRWPAHEAPFWLHSGPEKPRNPWLAPWGLRAGRGEGSWATGRQAEPREPPAAVGGPGGRAQRAPGSGAAAPRSASAQPCAPPAATNRAPPGQAGLFPAPLPGFVPPRPRGSLGC